MKDNLLVIIYLNSDKVATLHFDASSMSS